jgi:hypothetical protein
VGVAFIVMLVARVLGGYACVSARERPVAPPSLQALEANPRSKELTPSPWFASAEQSNPFGNLFAGRAKVPVKPSTIFKTPLVNTRLAQSPAQQSSVVCGMTLIPADPKVDAAIRHIVPENGRQFTIRTIQPQICRP